MNELGKLVSAGIRRRQQLLKQLTPVQRSRLRQAGRMKVLLDQTMRALEGGQPVPQTVREELSTLYTEVFNS